MQDFNDVLTFHAKFELPQDCVPVPMSDDRLNFRLPFLFEEISEYQEAYQQDNLVAGVDALLDLVYVALGTALFIGCPRTGALAAWPSFDDVKYQLLWSRIIQPKAPTFMRAAMNRHFVVALTQRLDAFNQMHNMAHAGDLNAIELALLHLRYLVNTAYAMAVLMNVPWRACWKHVQDANMAKVRANSDGSNSKRKTPWDVVKPEGWVAPDVAIALELMKAGWQMPVGMNLNHVTGKVTL